MRTLPDILRTMAQIKGYLPYLLGDRRVEELAREEARMLGLEELWDLARTAQRARKIEGVHEQAAATKV